MLYRILQKIFLLYQTKLHSKFTEVKHIEIKVFI